MKNFTYLTLILATFTLSVAAHGKKQIYEGYVVTLDNDTIRGQVQYVNPTFNELRVIFYKDGDKRKFTPKELKGYGFVIERYNKATKSKEQEWIHYERRQVEASPIRQGAKEVFVQRQLSGSIKLYNFYTLKSNKINSRYYDHVYYISNGADNMTLVNRKNYRKVVRQLVSNNKELYNKLGTAGYGYKYFASVVAEQNIFLDGMPDNVKQDVRWADSREKTTTGNGE